MLTVALSLAPLGAAIVESRLSIPALRWAVVGVGIVVAGGCSMTHASLEASSERPLSSTGCTSAMVRPQ